MHKNDVRWHLALGLSFVLYASNVHASDWMIVGAEGESPNRTMIYSEFTNLMTRLEVPLDQTAGMNAWQLMDARLLQALVIQVNESPSAPDAIWYTVQVHCNRKEMRLAEVITWQRDSTHQVVEPNEWIKIGSAGWPSRVHLLACDSEKLQRAIARAKAGDTDALGNLGLAYAGNETAPFVDEMTWTTYWKDGMHPGYTTTKTNEERARDFAAFDKLAAETGEKMKGVEKEMTFMLEVQDNFGRKSDEQQQAFAGMEGWTEQEIIDAWGAPDSSAQGGQTRSMVYGYQRERYDVVDSSVAVMGRRGQVGELRQSEVQARQQDCRRVLQLREGGSKPGYRLYDYSYDCP